MKKIKNLEGKMAHHLFKDYIELNAVLQTVKSTTFSDLSDCIDVHVREISRTKEGNFNLKWIHIDLRNLYDQQTNDSDLSCRGLFQTQQKIIRSKTL